MSALVEHVSKLGLPQSEATAATKSAVEALGLRTAVVSVGENQVVSSVMLGTSKPVLVVGPSGSVAQATAGLVFEGRAFIVRNIR
ncbi:hypothetical protein WME76_42575 [Sorangium sp. So ce119]|uniref:hypothetical protein n=1 Tax=Sorangium sp. So ce119 TaxID=3133279 RepID=UPI003F5FA172